MVILCYCPVTDKAAARARQPPARAPETGWHLHYHEVQLPLSGPNNTAERFQQHNIRAVPTTQYRSGPYNKKIRAVQTIQHQSGPNNTTSDRSQQYNIRAIPTIHQSGPNNTPAVLLSFLNQVPLTLSK